MRDAASGATLQWGWAGLEAPKAASLASLQPNAAVYREGETMSVVVPRGGRRCAGSTSACASATTWGG